MRWKTVKNCGKVSKISMIEGGPGSGISRFLLYESSISFIKACTQYYNFVGEFPFTYSERQLNSVLLPAFVDNSDSVFLEQPVSRKKRRHKPTTGRLDYWIAYGDTVFLVELKHSWGVMESPRINEITKKKWKDGISQIRSMKKSDVTDISIKGDKVIKMVLMIMPFYVSTTKDKKSLKRYNIKDIEKKHKTTLSDLNPEPHWSLTWYLHDKLQKPQLYDYKKTRFEKYPMLEIFAFIEKLVIQ